MLPVGPVLVAVTAGVARAEQHFGKIGTPRRGLIRGFPESNAPSRVRTGTCYAVVSQSAGNAHRRDRNITAGWACQEIRDRSRLHVPPKHLQPGR